MMGGSTMNWDANAEKPWMGEQLKELCCLMIHVLDQGFQQGLLDEEEYRRHISRKKEFLEESN